MAGRKKQDPPPRPKRAVSAAGHEAKQELTHTDIQQASARVDPELRRRSELLWDDRAQATRGPKAAQTPDDVIQAAVRIADEKGLSALTMHALATQLGFTTMAVYRYFPSKDALYDAIVDAGLGHPPRPATPREDWRTEVTQWAHAKQEMLCARPWLAELPFVAAPHGPNWLRWLEALAASLSRAQLTPADVGQMLSVIDGYTRGASDTAISLARVRARGESVEAWAAAVGADLGRAIGDARFPTFATILTTPAEGAPRTMTESFDFGLQRVLDGIELYVKSATTSSGQTLNEQTKVSD